MIKRLLPCLCLLVLLTGCYTFKTDYTQQFKPFLDYSLGEWTATETDRQFADIGTTKRSWDVTFYDRDGGEQTLSFDNAALPESDKKYFLRFVCAKALEMAGDKLRDMIVVEDSGIAAEVYMLTSVGVLSDADVEAELSTESWLKLSDLDIEGVAANPSHYALIRFFYSDRAAYDSAAAGVDDLRDELCERLGSDVNMIIDFTLMSRPLTENGKRSGEILETTEVGWIGSTRLIAEEGQESLKDSFPGLLRKNLKNTAATGGSE